MGLIIGICKKGKGLVSHHGEGEAERKSSGEQEGICMGRNTHSLVTHCPKVGLENVRGLQSTHN